MNTVENRRLLRPTTLFFCLLLSLMLSPVGTSREVLAACGGVTNVSNETELNNRIADFNSRSGPCHYTIALTTDIFLNASATTIDNPAEDVDLVLAGNGYFISGQFMAGVRPVTIASDTTVTMQHITIGAGNAAINGGGIHNSGNLTLTSTVVTLNIAGQEGGGLWNGAQGTVTIQSGTTIEGNTASSANAANDAQGGGGIFNNGGTITISNATISNNTADGSVGPDDGGGGIFNDGRITPGTVTLNNTTVSGNEALSTWGNGGGILNIGDVDATPTVTVTGGLIDDNHTYRAGGGIETNRGILILDDVSVTNNTTGINGGGVHSTSGDFVTISGGAISGNTAGQEGGGVWNSITGMMTIQNGTTIDGNTANSANAAGDAQGGGGIFNNGGTVNITDSLIRDNIADGSVGPDDGGGGIFNDGRITPGTVMLTNTTVSGNTALSTWGNGGGILNIGDG